MIGATGSPVYARLAALVTGQAVRAAMAIEEFLAEAQQDYGLSGDEAMALLQEANSWAIARATDPLARARQLLQERAS